MRQTLVENFGIDCQYYAKVDFKSFEKVIDALFMNGVKIDAEKDLNLDGVDIKKGVQKMDGHVLCSTHVSEWMNKETLAVSDANSK